VSTQILVINTIVRRLLDMFEQARHRDLRDEIMADIDELENQFDALIQANAPERITDERFTAAINAIHRVSEKFERLRELVVKRQWVRAKRQLLDLQAAIREAHRIFILVRAGAPMHMIFQVSPEFIRKAELKPPEELVFTTPLATQIYNVIVRRGKATIEELARELNVTDEMRGEFNNALATLIQRGYVRAVIGPDNKMVLQAVR